MIGEHQFSYSLFWIGI